MGLGENIKKYRKMKKITQKTLGEIINKKEITIRKYESDLIQPPVEILSKIAIALDVTINDLIGINKPIINNQLELALTEIYNQHDLHYADFIVNNITNYFRNEAMINAKN